MLLPNCLLQKCSNKASNTISKDHLSGILELWKKGKEDVLLSECIAIEKRLEISNSSNRKPEYNRKFFRYFIKIGNINT